MTKFPKNLKLQTTDYKLLTSGGYAAMFSFVIMLTVVGSIFLVFSLMALNTLYAGRIMAFNMKNFYAADGLAEDALLRTSKPNLADPTNGETLAVGDVLVTLNLNLVDSIYEHKFSSQIQNRYSSNEILKIDKINPSAIKIKEWKESL